MVELVTHRRDAIAAVIKQVIDVAQRDLEVYTDQLRVEKARGDHEAAFYSEGMVAGLQFVVDVLRGVLRLL